MKRLFAVFALGVLALAVAAAAPAQIKEIPGDTVTVSGTVEAIDHTNRVVTLQSEKDGEFVTVDVPESARRFDEIKVGDKVSRAEAGEGRRPGGLHVDRGRHPRGVDAQEVTGP